MSKHSDTLRVIVELIGSVDHTKGNGSNAAKMRGELLNDIRLIAHKALNEGEIND